MASTDLITRVRARENPALATGITDDYLDILISASSVQIQGWLNRDLKSQDFTEARDGEGDQTLFLPNSPVTKIKQVDFLDNDGTVNVVMANGADDSLFFRLGDGGEIMFLINNPSDFIRFPEGFKNVLVIYTAGFSTIPEDIQEGTAEQIVFLLQEGSDASNKSSEKLGDYSVSFDTSASGANFSKTAFQLLAKYKKIVL